TPSIRIFLFVFLAGFNGRRQSRKPAATHRQPLASWTAAGSATPRRFVRTLTTRINPALRAHASGAEATAFQTLSRLPGACNRAQRLDCVRFTAAFARTDDAHLARILRPHQIQPSSIWESPKKFPQG
ncbi:MAG: hypothetical protein P4N60_13405, partial [Verrucomicrobiae bacterium]|nr:hypothetical protein [Verrucomicrobiae bacterium]